MTTENERQHEQPNLREACTRKALYITFVTIPILLYCAFWFFWFALFVSPGFVRLVYWYHYKADRIQVQYKDGPTFCMDIYGADKEEETAEKTQTDSDDSHSESSSQEMQNGNGDVEECLGRDAKNNPTPKPVVICVAGGGWIFGDKMWGGLLSRTLSPAGVMVVVPQYRNYPTTNIPGMVDDIQDAIQWTLDNCRE